MDSLKFTGGCLTINSNGKYGFKDPSLLWVTADNSLLTKSLGEWTSYINLTPSIFGTPPNYSEFEEDGTLVAHGDATTWDDINVSSLALGTGASAPTIVNIASSTIRSYAFNGSTSVIDELHGSLELLHNYEEGTNIIPHVHWMPRTNDSGNIKWQLEYIWINNNGVPMSSSTTISVVVPSGGVAWIPKITPFDEIVGSGKIIGSRFVFRIFRNPMDSEDTYSNDAVFTDFGVHYQVNSLGSRQPYIK